MNNYASIESVIERLQSDFDWSHSFIKECYLQTAHTRCQFVDESGLTRLGDVSGSQQCRLVVSCAGNSNLLGIEFLFANVSVFSIQTLEELEFGHEYDVHAGHSVRFTGHNSRGECWINAQSVLVRFLTDWYLADSLLLGFEFPTTEAFSAERVEGYWRQCGNCKNIWEESSKVEFSRCPECKEITQLNKPGVIDSGAA